MADTYTILGADCIKQLPAGEGKSAKNIWSLQLQDSAGNVFQGERFAEESEQIQIGARVELDKRWNDKWDRWDVFPPRRGGGKGGYGGPKETHPTDRARMGRAHAQDMALRTLELSQRLQIPAAFEGVQTPGQLAERAMNLADQYEEDVASRAGATNGSAPPSAAPAPAPVAQPAPQPAVAQQAAPAPAPAPAPQPVPAGYAPQPAPAPVPQQAQGDDDIPF